MGDRQMGSIFYVACLHAQYYFLKLLVADREKDHGHKDQVEQCDQQNEASSRAERGAQVDQTLARLWEMLINHARSTLLKSGCFIGGKVGWKFLQIRPGS